MKTTYLILQSSNWFKQVNRIVEYDYTKKKIWFSANEKQIKKRFLEYFEEDEQVFILGSKLYLPGGGTWEIQLKKEKKKWIKIH